VKLTKTHTELLIALYFLIYCDFNKIKNKKERKRKCQKLIIKMKSYFKRVFTEYKIINRMKRRINNIH